MVIQRLDYTFDSLGHICKDDYRVSVLSIRGIRRVKIRVRIIIWRIIRRITSRDTQYSWRVVGGSVYRMRRGMEACCRGSFTVGAFLDAYSWS